MYDSNVIPDSFLLNCANFTYVIYIFIGSLSNDINFIRIFNKKVLVEVEL